MILIICSFYSFLSNSALLGPSVYITIYAEEFKISAQTASGLISYPNLAYGFGSLFLVPAYLKFGRRPILLLSLLTVGNKHQIVDCTLLKWLTVYRWIDWVLSSINLQWTHGCTGGSGLRELCLRSDSCSVGE